MNQTDLWTSLGAWHDIPSFIQFSKENKVNPFVRLLLTSGGTLTTVLQSLLMEPVQLEVVKQILTVPDPQTAGFLELEKPGKGFFREIWLLNDRKERIVYARSFLPLHSLSPYLLQELELKTRSIGELIDSSCLPSLRDKMSFLEIHSPFLSREFNLSSAAPLWCRRYRLSVPEHLAASIFEVFSSSLFNPE